jgi:hypothetical protein
MYKPSLLIAGCAAIGVLVHAQSTADRDVLAKMRAEGTERSQVGPVFDMFTVDIGPRLTGSPAHKRAADFARDRLAADGLANARLEPWPFARSWTLEKLTLEMVEPRYMPLIGYAEGWSPSTAGEIVAAPVWLAGKTADEVEAMRDSLKGAIVMSQPILTNFVRRDRADPSAPDYQSPPPAGRGGGRGGNPDAQRIARVTREAGIGVLLRPSIGEHGTVFVTGRDNGPGAAPSVVLSAEHYNMIARMLERHVPVRLRVNVQGKFYEGDGHAYNVLAELPGTDPALKDEVVMIGGHLDSWHTSVGATDNADGATTVIEAMRILKAIGARPRRTIRVALWGGEEQGLLGSKAWVDQHLAGDAHAAERDTFDVYFNIDPGYGPIYGWFLERSEAVRPIFDAWLDPLKAIGARRNVIDGIGATDHLSFIAAGVPGFNPIQSYEGYDVRMHHTNVDTAERLKQDDIKQSAIVMAWFAYNAAMADQKIPREAGAGRAEGAGQAGGASRTPH